MIDGTKNDEDLLDFIEFNFFNGVEPELQERVQRYIRLARLGSEVKERAYNQNCLYKDIERLQVINDEEYWRDMYSTWYGYNLACSDIINLLKKVNKDYNG